MSYDWFGASFLSLSRCVVSAKLITYRHWNENRSSKGRICSSLRTSKFLSDAECAVTFIYFSLLPSWSLIKLDISNQIDKPYKFPGTKESVYTRKMLNYHRIGYFRVSFALCVKASVCVKPLRKSVSCVSSFSCKLNSFSKRKFCRTIKFCWRTWFETEAQGNSKMSYWFLASTWPPFPSQK